MHGKREKFGALASMEYVRNNDHIFTSPPPLSRQQPQDRFDASDTGIKSAVNQQVHPFISLYTQTEQDPWIPKGGLQRIVSWPPQETPPANTQRRMEGAMVGPGSAG